MVLLITSFYIFRLIHTELAGNLLKLLVIRYLRYRGFCTVQIALGSVVTERQYTLKPDSGTRSGIHFCLPTCVVVPSSETFSTIDIFVVMPSKVLLKPIRSSVVLQQTCFLLSHFKPSGFFPSHNVFNIQHFYMSFDQR